jgi:Cu-Zn family superoxide dismutase
MAKCVCSLTSESGSSVTGILRLSQSNEDAPTLIEGELRGLSSGKHGISICQAGDLSEGASSCGPIFNPFGKTHGAPEDEERMAGDLGNVFVEENGKCQVSIQDKVVKLIGPHSVIGRSVVLYQSEDDRGRGGHDNSLTTGNAGPRVAAGVIGISL